MNAAALGRLDGRSCCRAALTSLLLVMLWPVPVSHAQSFRVQAGSSTLTRATGGSFDVRGRTYDASIGAGEIFGRFRVGALVRKKTKNSTLSFGDDAVDFALPTDTLGGRYYFLARGAGLTVARPGFSLFALAGTTANSVGAPFFRAADASGPLGLVFFDKQIAPRWRFFSRNVIAERQTSLQGVEWIPRASLKVAAAGGIGAGEGYASASAHYDGGWLVAHGGYVAAGRQFRRIQIDSPSSSESDRENVSVTIRPSASWSLNASRQNLLQPDSKGGAAARVTVNHLGGNLNAAGFRVTAGLFDAHGERTDNLGASIGVGRALTETVDASLTYFTSTSGRGPASGSFAATFRETLGPRLTLVQIATHASGQTSLKFGGSFLSNPVAVGIDYQTVYAPFRVGNPFVQAITLHVRVLIRNVPLQVATFTTPTGRTRYMVSGSQSWYRSPGGSGSAPDTIRLARYLIQGRVIEENGRPVPGAVLRISGEFVLTDSAGQFFLRMKKAAPCRIEVATDEFPGPGYFQVTSAPGSVVPATDDTSVPITIRVRRSDRPH